MNGSRKKQKRTEFRCFVSWWTQEIRNPFQPETLHLQILQNFPSNIQGSHWSQPVFQTSIAWSVLLHTFQPALQASVIARLPPVWDRNSWLFLPSTSQRGEAMQAEPTNHKSQWLKTAKVYALLIATFIATYCCCCNIVIATHSMWGDRAGTEGPDQRYHLPIPPYSMRRHHSPWKRKKACKSFVILPRTYCCPSNSQFIWPCLALRGWEGVSQKRIEPEVLVGTRAVYLP